MWNAVPIFSILAMSAIGSPLERRQFGLDALSNLKSTTLSDIKDKQFECKKAALIFARGTGEPGNMGYVVGPPLATQLKKALNNDVLIQGADYTTNFSGGGAKVLAQTSKSVMAKCPNTKIVLGGYSQGAMQVHQALGQLGSYASKIAAAVTFGDPYSNMGWGSGGIVGAFMGLGSSAKGAKGDKGDAPSFNPENGLILCSTGDFVCGLTPNIGGSSGGSKSKSGGKSQSVGSKPQTGGGSGGGHLSYSSDGSINKAVQFIISRIGEAPAPSPAPAPASLSAPAPVSVPVPAIST